MLCWSAEAETPTGNHDRFPTLPDGERDVIRSHNHVDTWKLMEKLLDTGKTKGIGVCNVGSLAPPLRSLAPCTQY